MIINVKELDGYEDELLMLAKQGFLDIIWSVSTPYLYYFALKDDKEQEFFAQNTSRNQENYYPKYVCFNVSAKFSGGKRSRPTD